MSAESRLAALAALFSYPDGSLFTREREPYTSLPSTLRERLDATAPATLEAEFIRLFVNALPELPCAPYASLYLDGALLGESAAWLRSMYRRWGVETDEMPDHFAVECAFLSGLAGAAAKEPDAAADFDALLDHLVAWAPDFLAGVERHDRTGFYREAARFALAVIEEQTAARSLRVDRTG